MKVEKESLCWVLLMKYFYDERYEHDTEVIDAWYNYVFYFLPLVNKLWRDAISSDNLKNKKRMFPTLFVSDEALVIWILKLQLPKTEENYKIGFDKSKKNLGTGKQDTNINLEQYIIIHDRISQCRSDPECALRWNEIFWMEVEKRHADKFKKRKSSPSSKYTSIKKTLPLPDMNEEDDIFEKYKKTRKNTDAEIKADEVGSCNFSL